MIYHVDFTLDGEAKSKVIDATDAGHAFATCLKENPGALLVKAWVQGEHDFGGYCEFDPPPVQREPQKELRPCRALKPKEREGIMPFYDEVLRR